MEAHRSTWPASVYYLMQATKLWTHWPLCPLSFSDRKMASSYELIKKLFTHAHFMIHVHVSMWTHPWAVISVFQFMSSLILSFCLIKLYFNQTPKCLISQTVWEAATCWRELFLGGNDRSSWASYSGWEKAVMCNIWICKSLTRALTLSEVAVRVQNKPSSLCELCSS